jgi:hypothetical protein
MKHTEELIKGIKTLNKTQLFLLKSYIRMTQGNINMLIKTDKQMAKYFQEDLDSLQRDTGITDEELYAKEGEVGNG